MDGVVEDRENKYIWEQMTLEGREAEPDRLRAEGNGPLEQRQYEEGS